MSKKTMINILILLGLIIIGIILFFNLDQKNQSLNRSLQIDGSLPESQTEGKTSIYISKENETHSKENQTEEEIIIENSPIILEPE